MEMLLSTGHDGLYSMSSSPASSQVEAKTLGPHIPPFFHPFGGTLEMRLLAQHRGSILTLVLC